MTFHCSFCEKSQHEVRTLIVGPPEPNNKNHISICSECSSRLVNFLKKKDIKKIDNRKQEIDKKIYCNFCGKDLVKQNKCFTTLTLKLIPIFATNVSKYVGL